ncbi:MAG: hypothetical protein H0U75_07835 [Legionella sp.]|nr:hypothetical protein [Legionella sp.]
MKKKSIALVIGIVGSGASGGLILGQILKVGLLAVGPVIFAGLTTTAVFTGFGLLAVSAVFFGIGCYQLWKSWVKRHAASNEDVLNEFSSNSTNEYLLHRLPKVVLQHGVTKFLGESDVEAFAFTNKAMYGFLQPHRMLSSLLRSVVTGNEARVIQILKSYPELAVRQGFVTDNSGRSFPRVSAAELVRWCGDLRYMANAMLNVLQALPNQELAERIRCAWVAQNETYEKNGGLAFELPGRTEPEKPSLAFSLAPLLRELNVYLDNFDTMTWPQRQTHWCTKVGAEQFLLPAIYLQHYCNPYVPFYPTPSFDKPTFPRVLTVYGYNANQGVWDRGGRVLGRDFGVARGDEYARTVLRMRGPGQEGGAACDLLALRACEVRTRNDLLDLRSRLEVPLKQLQTESKSSHYSGS